MLSRPRKSRTPNHSWVLWSCLIGVLFGGVIAVGFSEFNPDWLAYQSIYESGGAWLSEQGRDPFFLFIIELFKYIFTSDGYIYLRVLLGSIFSIFSALLFSGFIIPWNKQRASISMLFLAVINIGLSRFVVQIREGLALVFLFWGIGFLNRQSDKPILIKKLMFVAIMLLACLTHSIMFLIASGFGVAMTENRWSKKLFSLIGKNDIIDFIIFSSAGVFIYLVFYLIGGNELIQQDIGERALMVVDASAVKYLLWAWYGLVVWIIYEKITKMTVDCCFGMRTKRAIQIIAGPITVIIYFFIITALVSGGAAAVISTFARILYLLLGVSLIFISGNSKFDFKIILLSVFLIVDQIRIIMDSIFMHFGVRLLLF